MDDTKRSARSLLVKALASIHPAYLRRIKHASRGHSTISFVVRTKFVLADCPIERWPEESGQ